MIVIKPRRPSVATKFEDNLNPQRGVRCELTPFWNEIIIKLFLT
jgi:hypothetical protein